MGQWVNVFHCPMTHVIRKVLAAHLTHWPIVRSKEKNH
jgi:hypothetical protein